MGESLHTCQTTGIHVPIRSAISVKSPFPRVAAILRASSPQQLDIPRIHALCLDMIEKMFPSGPRPFVHPDFLHEALDLSRVYHIPSVSTIVILFEVMLVT